MNITIQKALGRAAVADLMVVSLIVLGAFFASSSIVHAQFSDDGGCCDYYSSYTPDYDYYSSYTPDYDYYSSYTPSYDTYSSYTPDYDYYSSYTPDYDYYSSYTPDYDYYSSYTPSYGAYDYDFTNYDSGYSAAPFFFSEAPFFPPSPFSISAAPIAFPTPIFSQQPVFTPPPVFTNPIRITASPTVPVSVAQNQTQTQTQSNPIHITLSPSNPAQPFNIAQNAAPISVNNSTRVNTPNTNTNNNLINLPGQPPINITNTNINNNPAPVYPAPLQQLIQYTFPSNYQTPTCSITTSNSYYNSYDNRPVTLSWVSSNAFSATISPNVGSVNPNGSTTIYPTAGTTIYTMTVYGTGGSSTCQTQVVYQQQPVYTPPPSNVSCAINASKTSIKNGESTTLSWNSYNVSSATISDGIGSVAPSGSLTVRPETSRNYTLTVYGPQGQSAACHAAVTVAGKAPYVALSQIPYTGFDFGPIGNAIYWLSLLSFAIALAYLAVYYRGGLAFVTGVTSDRPRTKHVASQTRNDAVAPVTRPQNSAFANLPTREYRSATADAMSIAQVKSADEMPRIIITRN